MKKNYLIVCLFTMIMLLLPCSSAFEMPLSEEDKVELRSLINNENTNNQEKLDGIILYNQTANNLVLDLNEVERIYENYILTGNDSVINSDSWDWVIERLGWIYLTIDQVVTLYYTGISIYTEILDGSQAVQNFFDSIQTFRTSWQEFKANPLKFLTIKNLVLSTVDLLKATIDLLEYILSNELKEKIITFADQIQVFRDFLDSNPWLQPVIIKGNVTGFSESVTISVKSDSITTTDYYELEFSTDDTAIPWFVHKCIITATYQDKTDIKNRYAFSSGVIEEDYSPSDFNIKSKQVEVPVLVKLIFLLKQLLKDKFYILCL